MFNWTKIGCWRYRAALEDRAGGNELRPEANAKLDAHLDGCAECRQSLDEHAFHFCHRATSRFASAAR